MADKTLTIKAGEDPGDFNAGSVFFIGTATTIIRYGGFTILTDPNFLHKGEKVRLGYGLRSTRRTNPAINIEDLPPIDLVVLSHMHEDHFDRVAARKLDKGLPIVTTPQAAQALENMSFRSAKPLETWEAININKGDARLRITSMPGTHGPGILSKALPQVMGSMLEFGFTNGQTALRIYITGDTLVFDDLREIPRRYPDIDLGLLHLGGTRVMGIMLTMDGKQGVQALRITRPHLAIPIHFNDYTVFKSPLRDFAREVRAAGLEKNIRYLKHGQTYSFHVPDERFTWIGERDDRGTIQTKEGEHQPGSGEPSGQGRLQRRTDTQEAYLEQ